MRIINKAAQAIIAGTLCALVAVSSPASRIDASGIDPGGKTLSAIVTSPGVDDVPGSGPYGFLTSSKVIDDTVAMRSFGYHGAWGICSKHDQSLSIAEIQAMANDAGAHFGVSPDLIYAIILTESKQGGTPHQCGADGLVLGFGSDSYGLMQINIDYHPEVFPWVFDATRNVMEGTRIIKGYVDMCTLPENRILDGGDLGYRTLGPLECALRRYHQFHVCKKDGEDPFDCGGYVKETIDRFNNILLQRSSGYLDARQPSR